ncbi:MAG: hypothetical protein QXL17_02895 [Candidatus Thermoplasmatota archaeon]
MVKEICACAVCGKMLIEGDQLADLKVYDFDGELDHILLAHQDCAAQAGGDWEWDTRGIEPEEYDQFRDDVEADADALRSAGYGTDEDYGFFGDDYDDPF